MYIKQAFLKSNKSVLWTKKNVASNHINDTHEVHETSITSKTQEGETLLGCANLDAVKKGVSNVTKKRRLRPYRKYTDKDRAQIGK